MRRLNGYTVVELLVGIGLFFVIASASSVVFIRIFKAHGVAFIMQKNVQDVQFALNIISKTLRTSTVLSPSPGENVSVIRIFDNSQSKCIEYHFNNGLNSLEMRVASGANTREDCSLNPFLPGDTFQAMLGGKVTGSFTYVSSNGIPTDPESEWRVGRVTISLELAPPEGGVAHREIVRIQTTVSLRDYMEFQYNAFAM